MVVTTAKKLISNSCKLFFLPPHIGGQVYVYIALAMSCYAEDTGVRFCSRLYRFLIVLFLGRKTFAETVSSMLKIPSWRIFHIREEDSNMEGCMTVKFGIIGNG